MMLRSLSPTARRTFLAGLLATLPTFFATPGWSAQQQDPQGDPNAEEEVVVVSNAIEKPSQTDSLVRVNATLQAYNFIRPWEKGAPTPRRGLGVLLKGDRILVTAESVVNATYLELELPESGEKAPAVIVGRDYEANLALLAPAPGNEDFLKNKKPIEIDHTALPRETVEVWQVEDNGDGVSTETEVLRVSVGNYFVEGSVFLVYQLKGSLQSRANSFTLPIVKDNKLVGMLLSYSSKEQTSYILPAPIIEHFLADLEDGDYQGFPNLGIGYSQTLDEQLRRFTGLGDREGGIFIDEVTEDSSAGKAGLKQGDVILSIEGHAIDSRGNYEHPQWGKINFSHLVRGGAKVGDTVNLTVVRDGEEMELPVELMRKEPTEFLVDPYMFDRGPKYKIVGGLIFQELTVPYLQAWGSQWASRAPFKMVYAHANQGLYEKEGRRKLVFLSQVLRAPSTLGYENLGHIIVTKVNGKKINDIRDLAVAFQNPNAQGIHVIEFDEYPKKIFVDARLSGLVNQQLIQYGINQLDRLD